MSTSDQRARHRVRRQLFSTIPIVLAGSMAVSLGMTGPITPVTPKRTETPKGTEKPKTTPSELAKSVRSAFASAGRAAVNPSAEAATSAAATTVASAPTVYQVKAGDTVSSIAGQFGLATASVLALNGLGWKSVIFPGQQLKLTSSGAVPVSTAPTVSTGVKRYTIAAGDTIGAIAGRFGLSTQTLLSANGLGWSSIIYPGQTLAIPATTTTAAAAATPILDVTQASSVTPISTSTAIISPSTPFTAEMTANARTIISVGRSLGVPDYGIVVALAAALQESGLRNLRYGDRDSLGIFQQRPSTGWGTPAQVLDTTYAARLFFGGPKNPNAGNTRGLLDIAGWQSKTVTDAAQAVQRSGYPFAYAKWEAVARAALARLG